jgi:O-antigen biosynthesis protein
MALLGYLESVSHERIVGWAHDTANPDEPVRLVIAAGDEVVARVLATRHRGDLQRASIGSGCGGFDVCLDVPLSSLVRHRISVRREDDGAHLRRSPAVLDPASAFDHVAEASIERLLGGAAHEADLERRLRFLARQATVLTQRYVNGRRHSAAPHRPARRALVVDEAAPEVGRDAGSSALLSHVASLQRLGYAVTFAPADLARSAAFMGDGVTCCVTPWYSTIEDVLRQHAGDFELVYLHRLGTAARYAALVRHHMPRATVVWSVADLQSLRLLRQAGVEQRDELRAQSRQTQRVESIAAWYVDKVVTHSVFEATLLRQYLPAAKVHCVPWHVPIRPTLRPFDDRHGLAFVGNYRHGPNVDAAQWLIASVWPAIIERNPALTCLLVGRDMPDAVRRLATGSVQPVGAVADLAEIFDRVRVTIAPLAFGAGIKGKVLDSLAAGIPCVCTPAAAEGLDLPPLLLAQVATEPRELAAKVVRLHEDETLNRDCAQCGLEYVARFASEARIDKLLGTALGLPSEPESRKSFPDPASSPR